MWSVVRTIPLALILPLLGCGSGGERQSVTGVFRRLDDAQRRGDAREACEKVFLVREEGREAEEEEEGEDEGESGESPEACRAAFTAGQRAREAQVRSLSSKVESVHVDGDRATAKVRSRVVRADGSSFTNVYTRDLVRQDGQWRIRISPEG